MLGIRPKYLSTSDIARSFKNLIPVDGFDETIKISCPFDCQKTLRSLIVRFDGSWKCYLCGNWGFTNFFEIFFKNKGSFKNIYTNICIEKYMLENDHIKDYLLPDNFKKNYVTWKNQIKGLNQQAVDFLESKGVSVPLAINYGLGFKKKFEPFYINNINKMIGFDDPKIIIPQTNLDNEVVNLSSNSIQPNFESENNYLPLQISNFNSKAYLMDGEPLHICENIFDAFSLISSGINRVIATFGLENFRWDWVKRSEKNILLVFKNNSIESEIILKFLGKCKEKKIKVFRVTTKKFGGKVSLNDAYLSGTFGAKFHET
tara:strand:+ start:432 stop:1382 length:951 start_codon:yes stop_codon:yes gene_type:complete